MKIGVCGTGRMGSSIAQRLIAVGHEVGVWNRNADKTKPLTEAGAKLFEARADLGKRCGAVGARFGVPAELGERCEAVVVVVLNDGASQAVYRGTNGILNADLAGK